MVAERDEVRGASLNYQRFGQGKPLVLAHGFLGGGGGWLPTTSHVARYFDVIVPDLPGFAGSRALAPSGSIEGFAAALLAFLDGLGIGRFSLVGHSLGGEIAQQVGLDHPERIERLVLYGAPSSGKLPHRFETPEQTIRRIETEGIDAAVDRVFQSWFLDGAKNAYYEMCRDAGNGLAASTLVSTIRAIARWDVSGRLGELKMPVLVIGGDHDRSVGLDELLALHKGIPGSRLALIPGCAHNVHLERPELFNAILTEFLLAGD